MPGQDQLLPAHLLQSDHLADPDHKQGLYTMELFSGELTDSVPPSPVDDSSDADSEELQELLTSSDSSEDSSQSSDASVPSPPPSEVWSFRSDRTRFKVALDQTRHPQGWTDELKKAAWAHFAGRQMQRPSSIPKPHRAVNLHKYYNHTFPNRPLTLSGIRSAIKAEIKSPIRGVRLISKHTITGAEYRRRKRRHLRQQKQDLVAFAKHHSKFEVACSSRGATIRRNKLAKHLFKSSKSATRTLNAFVSAMHPTGLRWVYKEIKELGRQEGQFSCIHFFIAGHCPLVFFSQC